MVHFVTALINFTYICKVSKEMKRRTTSISFVIASMLILFVLSFVPHHHHDEGVPCFFPARCEHSGSSNEVPADHAATHGSQHGPSCVAGAEYTHSSNEGLIKCKSTSLPPYSLTGCLDVNLNDHTLTALPSTYIQWHAKAPLYQSTHVQQLHGLRAPPTPFA